jgi:hypothetical protein
MGALCLSVITLGKGIEIAAKVSSGLNSGVSVTEMFGLGAAVFAMGFLCGVVVWASRAWYRRWGKAGDRAVGLVLAVVPVLSFMVVLHPEHLRSCRGVLGLVLVAAILGTIGAWIGPVISKETRKTKDEPQESLAVTLQIGERTWHVAGSRLGSGTSLGDLHLDRRSETVFVLAPSLGDRVSVLPLVAFGIGILLCWACAFPNDLMPKDKTEGFWPIVGLVLGLGLSCTIALGAILLSLQIITQTVRFDKTAGTVTRRWLLRTQDVRSLQEVVAIQYLDVGWGWENIGEEAVRAHLYQFNLVLASPPGFRVNVYTKSDKRFTIREEARQVAAFLGVPLVEQHQNGKARTSFPVPGGAALEEPDEAWKCLACGQAIPEEASKCPSCAWSFRSGRRASDPGRTRRRS